jgi:predicted permease
MAFNLPLSTVAIYLSSKEKKPGKILMDIFKIPIFHAFIAAIIISQFSIPIPVAVNKSIKLAGSVSVPLLIFTLGLQLSNIRPRLSHFKIIVPGILIRLVISPVIACIALRMAEVSGLEFKVAMVQTSAPAALLPLMYAIRFKRSPDLLATIIMLTTILSGFSLTILIKMLG